MELESVLDLIRQYGYLSLFFLLWLGIVGMPIPDEAVVMTGGMIVAFGLLEPFPALLVTYLGVISGLTLGYVLGRLIGEPILQFLIRKINKQEYISRSYKLLVSYGSYTLCISYFFPVVRHVVPYLVGVGKMPFREYALFSYTTGFVWTLLFFSLGYFFGASIEQISRAVYAYGLYSVLVAPAAALAAWYWWQYRRGRFPVGSS